MKRFPFLPAAVLGVLMVVFASCTPLQDASGGYEEAERRGRVVDPYYGDVVLVRDAFTGRYYYVDAYRASLYDPFFDSRYYGSRSRWSTPYYGRTTNGGTVSDRPQAPQRSSEKINEARKVLRGGN